MRLGLRLRVVGFVSLVLFAIVGWAVVMFSQSFASRLRDGLLMQADQFAELATEPIGEAFLQYKDSGRVRITQQIENFVALNDTITNVNIYDVSGNLLYQQNNSSDTSNQTVSDQALQTIDTTYLYSQDNTIQQVVSPYVEDTGVHRYTIVYQIDSSSISADVSRTVNTTIAVGIAVIAVTILAVSLLLELLLLKPISKLQQAAESVSKSDNNTEIPVFARNDEIGDLSRSVEIMANKLQADIEQLRGVDKSKSEFMALSSHYLRTPITVLKACMELLGDSKNNNQKSRALAIANATQATEKLYELTENILLIARFQVNTGDIESEEVEINSFLTDLCTTYKVQAADKGLDFTAKFEGQDSTVNISKEYLKIIIDNVFSNALHFTASGGITLQAAKDNNAVSISITDTGRGIAQKELSRLFEGFHIGEDFMTMTESHTGLGLYTIKLIIEKHGGNISVTSEQDKGTCVTITLPSIQ
ncbi:TPA: HAMP domain-containing histidine kinase [Candidatus Saccharibacteria bacterium]|nr:HAMP domain-containing histidine kinase [Candidatus Saccharibacteria bacterium]HIO87481.1 HAMP domain-containing histidine kinase [Candidatus Saccharibacteria bacterium]